MLKLNTKRKLKYRRLFFDKDNPGIKKIIKILVLAIVTSWIFLNESIEEWHSSDTGKGSNDDMRQSDNRTFKLIF